MMADIFGLIGDMSSVGFSNDVVGAIMSGFKIIGFPLVGIAILSLCLKQYVNIMDGQQINIGNTLQRVIFGVVVYNFGVTIMQYLYIYLIDFGEKVIGAISGVDVEFDLSMFNFEAFSYGFALILLIVSLFYMLKNIFDLVERFWLYFVTLMLLYLYLPGYIAGNDESLVMWFKQCIAIVMTQVFQTTILALGMSMFIAGGNFADFLLCIGAIIGASKIDQVLDKFGYSAGGKMGNIARNGMSMAFYARSIFK